jgi:Predicted membrane protein (DUF2157)
MPNEQRDLSDSHGQSDLHGLPGLPAQLERWVRDGLISSDQAARIAAAEGLPVSRPEARPGDGSGFLAAGRGGYVVEALGYLGGTLAAVAGFIAVNQVWPDIPDWAELAFAGAGAVLLLITGAAIRAGSDPALLRLRSVLWALSAGCVAAFTALLAGRRLDLDGTAEGLLTSAVTAAWAMALWWRLRTPIQHVVLYLALAATVLSSVSVLVDDRGAGVSGVAIWAFSAIWAGLAVRAIVTPVEPGLVVAGAGALVGAQLTIDSAAGSGLAVLTVAALLGAGVVLRRVWLLGLGALGVVIVVPQVASRYLPASVAAPLAVFVVGLLLLALAVWLSRSNRLRRPRSS